MKNYTLNSDKTSSRKKLNDSCMGKIQIKGKNSSKKASEMNSKEDLKMVIILDSADKSGIFKKPAANLQIDTPIFQRVHLDEKAIDFYKKQEKKVSMKPPPIKLNKSSKKNNQAKKIDNFRSPHQRKKAKKKSSISSSQGRYNLDIFKDKKVKS